MKILLFLLLWPLSGWCLTQSLHDDGYSVKIVSDDPHSVQLVDSNRLALKNRLELIEQAQSSILMETYYFYPDEGGQVLLKALIEKKKKSPQVSVSLLFDSWASSGLSVADVDFLREKGIEVRWYVGEKMFPGGPQRHDHRKTWVFDNQAALIGGYNQASEHMGFSPLYNMVDREVLLKGPVIANIREAYLRIWKNASPVLPQGLSHESHVNEIESIAIEKVRESVSASVARFPAVQVNHLSYLTDVQKKTEISPFLKQQVDEFFRSAHQRIFIEVRFFIPTWSTWMALFEKIRSGTPVHVLTNSFQSILPLENHFLALGKFVVSQLGFFGADVHYFSGGLKDFEQAINSQSRKASWGTHCKTYIADDQIMIGSYNIDPASDYLNLEHFLVFKSGELADQAAQSIRNNSLN